MDDPLINEDLFSRHKAHFEAIRSYSSLDLLYTQVVKIKSLRMKVYLT